MNFQKDFECIILSFIQFKSAHESVREIQSKESSLYDDHIKEYHF